MSGKLPIAITMGDPAGIGPEVAIKAALHPDSATAGPFLLIGCRNVFEKTAEILGISGVPCQVASPEELTETGLSSGFLEVTTVPFEGHFGSVQPDLAEAAAVCVEQAALFALGGRVAAMVTAPLTKEGLALSGRDYPGHTEMLAHLSGSAGKELMLLSGGGLRVALVTTHMAIGQVPAAITSERVLEKISALAAGLRKDLGVIEPRIAVLALNPHAGESGRFGSEEALEIAPAIEAAASRGIRACGPLPADTAFVKALRGDFDAVLAAYHDQGLAVLKTLAFDSGVNVTMGLPIVRTSPDHGTAYDIAGRGIASERSTVEAIRLARRIADNRSSARG